MVDINDYKQLGLFSNKFVFEGDYVKELQMEVTATSKSTILGDAKVEKRKNNLLFGDLPSDYYMTQQLQLDTQISIGYLEKKNEK